MSQFSNVASKSVVLKEVAKYILAYANHRFYMLLWKNRVYIHSFSSGAIEIVLVTNNIVDKCREFIADCYFVHETVAKISGVASNPAARKELAIYSSSYFNDGISLAAVEKATGRIVSVSIQHIQNKCNNDELYEKIMASCTEKESKHYLEIERTFFDTYDVMEECGVNCVVELSYCATLPEYYGRGITKIMGTLIVDISKKLAAGTYVRYALDGMPHNPLPLPKVVYGINLTPATAHVAAKIGIPEVKRIPFREAFKNHLDLFKDNDGYLYIHSLLLDSKSIE